MRIVTLKLKDDPSLVALLRYLSIMKEKELAVVEIIDLENDPLVYRIAREHQTRIQHIKEFRRRRQLLEQRTNES